MCSQQSGGETQGISWKSAESVESKTDGKEIQENQQVACYEKVNPVNERNEEDDNCHSTPTAESMATRAIVGRASRCQCHGGHGPEGRDLGVRAHLYLNTNGTLEAQN